MIPGLIKKNPSHSISTVIFCLFAIIYFLIIPGSLSCAEPKARAPDTTKVEHDLTIIHPGDSTAQPMPHTLVQALGKGGEPQAYSMWVDSVICRDKTCEVVKVQLHWDALGHYQRFNVALGSQLTKLDHVPFTEKDLKKLQNILKDPDSPLKEVEKESMIAKAPANPAKPVDGIAAVSQPTILTLKTAVIIGAGYTCYDLWHWSNGLLTNRIRDLTGKDCSEEQLLAYLKNKKTDSALFALKYSRGRKISNQRFIDAVIERSKKGNEALIKPAIAYLREAAPSEQDYYDSIVSLFAEADSKKRLIILEALMSDNQKPVAGFYDQLCDHLPELDSYFEVHLFLNLMEKHNKNSSRVSEKTIELLKHPKFFVSRRAYWYLEKQTLPENLQQQVDAYFKKNKDRL